MIRSAFSVVAISITVLLLSSCSILNYNSYFNVEVSNDARKTGQHTVEEVPSAAKLASLDIEWDLYLPCRNKAKDITDRNNCEKSDTNFLAVAVSGGGSRSAVFSAQVFFELQRYGVLQQSDVISSVSGGSYTSAFYALSCDNAEGCPPTVEGPSRFLWDEDVVFPLLERNYLWSWFGNWFWPDNFVRYWLTDYDRTNIMAETLSDNLYDNSYLGNEGFRFHDLSPRRPNLIINATNNTASELRNPTWSSEKERICKAGQDKYNNLGETPFIVCNGINSNLEFNFTKQYFSCICSNLDQYPIADAVTASAAFPGGFQYVTLGDCAFSKPNKCDGGRYLHLFDGGTSENLGLAPINKWLVREKNNKYIKNRAVILIDGSSQRNGVSTDKSDPRSGMDFIIDLNFLDAYDTLMHNLKEKTIKETMVLVNNTNNFINIDMNINLEEANDPDLDKDWYGWAIIRNISTNLNIDENDAACLRIGARKIVRHKMKVWKDEHPGKTDFLNIPDSLGSGKPLPKCVLLPSKTVEME